MSRPVVAAFVVAALLAPGTALADYFRARSFEAGRGYVCEHAVHCVDPGCEPGQVCRIGGEDGRVQGCFDPNDMPCCISDFDCPPIPELGPVVEARCRGREEFGFFGLCQYVRVGEDPSSCELTFSYAGSPCLGTGWGDGDCDGDGVPNPEDDCPCASNPDQLDCDQDGVGAACAAPPRDGIAPFAELCPGAMSYEETRCQGRWCGCRGISGPDDPFCAAEACRELSGVVETADLCPAAMDAGVDAGLPDAGFDGGVDAGLRDAGMDVMDAGANSSPPTSCDLSSGHRPSGSGWAWACLAVFWAARRRSR